MIEESKLYMLAKNDENFAEGVLRVYYGTFGEKEHCFRKDDFNYSDKVRGKAVYKDELKKLAEKLCETEDLSDSDENYINYIKYRHFRNLDIYSLLKKLSNYKKYNDTDFFSLFNDKIATEFIALDYWSSVVENYQQGLQEEVKIFSKYLGLDKDDEGGLY